MPDSSRVDGPRSPWLFGPAADLLFVANVTWPLVALAVWLCRRAADPTFELLLSAVIGTPHRWITLGVLANDRERLKHRLGTIAAVGAATTAGFAGLWWWTHDLGLLLLIRFLWNVWHVAAQNTGVTRIYAIAADPSRRTGGAAEKWLLRGFMVYAYLRIGGMAFGEAPGYAGWLGRVSAAAAPFDGLAALAPLALIAREALSFDPRLKAKYVHLASALANYAAMVWCAHRGLVVWAVAVSTGNAVFHATEYFSIVTWSVRRQSAREGALFVPGLARNWLKTLAFFLVAMALGTTFLATRWWTLWALLNTLVSYLHYAWDGVIWKMPAVFPQASAMVRPARAQPDPRAA